mmetsp:Transcript_57920/g.126957  ORF Transcript_57920/g.126957 Transcript_57920/m.126957 type:complete len:140 (+) Transcript_57920:576-995(+)
MPWQSPFKSDFGVTRQERRRTFCEKALTMTLKRRSLQTATHLHASQSSSLQRGYLPAIHMRRTVVKPRSPTAMADLLLLLRDRVEARHPLGWEGCAVHGAAMCHMILLTKAPCPHERRWLATAARMSKAEHLGVAHLRF